MQYRTPDLDEQLDRLESVCPRYLCRAIHVVRKPRLRWLRTIAGLLLMVGSLFWFLPILGLEMFPVGLMLLAVDIPVLRPPVAHMIAWGERVAVQCFALGARLKSSRRNSHTG